MIYKPQRKTQECRLTKRKAMMHYYKIYQTWTHQLKRKKRKKRNLQMNQRKTKLNQKHYQRLKRLTRKSTILKYAMNLK